MTHLEVPNFPPPREDEFFTGYKARLAAVNNCTSLAVLSRLLRRRFPSADGEIMLSVEAALGVPRETLIRNHTLYPLVSAFRHRHHKLGATSSASESHGVLRRDLWLCSCCIKDDRPDGAYWRRSHQVPGTYQCTQHLVPLLRVRHPGSALMRDPSDCLGAATEPDEYVDETEEAARVDAQEILLGILREGPTISLEDVKPVLKNWLVEAVGSLNTLALLDFISASYSRVWIVDMWGNEDLPGYANRFFERQKLSAGFVASVAAVTNDSVADALDVLLVNPLSRFHPRQQSPLGN